MNEGNAPIFLTVSQGSAEWARWRLGRPSASQFSRIVTAKGNAAPASAKVYKHQLIAERIFRVSFQKDVGDVPAVKWGRDNEDPAREALQKKLNTVIMPGGAVMTRDCRVLASPDGFIGDQPVEIKCPQIPGQIQNILLDPVDYWPQIQGQMYVVQADSAHFWSWHPDCPPVYRRVNRDNLFIRTLASELDRFCDELDRDEEAVKRFGTFNVPENTP